MSKDKDLNDELLEHNDSVDFKETIDPDDFIDDSAFDDFDDFDDNETDDNETVTSKLDDNEFDDNEFDDNELDDKNATDESVTDQVTEVDSEIEDLENELSKVKRDLSEDDSDSDKKSDKKVADIKEIKKSLHLPLIIGTLLGCIGGAFLLLGDDDESTRLNKDKVSQIPIHAEKVSADKSALKEVPVEIIKPKDFVISSKVIVDDIDLTTKDTEVNDVIHIEDDNIITEEYFNLKSAEIQDKLMSEFKSKATLSDFKDELIDHRVRAEGINITDTGSKKKTPLIEDQKGKSNFISEIGEKISYYGKSVTVTDIFLDGELIFLSGGLYADTTYTKVNNEKMKNALANIKAIAEKTLETERLRQEKINLSIKEKVSRATDERVRKELAKANIDKNKSLASAIDKSAEIEVKTKKKVIPKILVGWTVNGHFTVVKGGYILNGYLLKDSKGGFHRAIVGENLDNYGLVRGYDGNGRFFLGENYIK
jgi:hypothetical protein